MSSVGEPWHASEGADAVQAAPIRNAFGLTLGRARSLKPDAVVMHPGPVNRGVELAPEVADGPANVILEQVANGVAVRMAILESCG